MPSLEGSYCKEETVVEGDQDDDSKFAQGEHPACDVYSVWYTLWLWSNTPRQREASAAQQATNSIQSIKNCVRVAHYLKERCNAWRFVRHQCCKRYPKELVSSESIAEVQVSRCADDVKSLQVKYSNRTGVGVWGQEAARSSTAANGEGKRRACHIAELRGIWTICIEAQGKRWLNAFVVDSYSYIAWKRNTTKLKLKLVSLNFYVFCD